MARVNIPLAEMQARSDFNRHTALAFYRGDKWTEYLAFEPTGLQKFREPTAKFEERYNKKLETPLEHVALAFVRSLKSAYLPGDGVAEIILEVYIMAATNNNDLTALDTKALLDVYNKLAVAASKVELKSFKESKTKLIARIEALQEEVAKLTPKQSANKTVAADKAAKRLAGLEDKKTAAKEKAAPKTEGKKAEPAKPAEKQKPKPPAPKGQGIGAYCMDLIQKGKSNAEVLEAAKKQFPDSKTSASSVAWYRNKLKADGVIA